MVFSVRGMRAEMLVLPQPILAAGRWEELPYLEEGAFLQVEALAPLVVEV